MKDFNKFLQETFNIEHTKVVDSELFNKCIDENGLLLGNLKISNEIFNIITNHKEEGHNIDVLDVYQRMASSLD